MGTYQTLPDLAPNFWNLIKFTEHEDANGLHWLMRKDQCMHCAEPGCLVACPAPGAIVQYTNGIVDFQQEHCIGCGYCMTGCPFNVPKFNQETKRVYKCTMCVDRTSVGLQPACVKACPTSCLQFGTKEEMLEVAGHARRTAQGERVSRRRRSTIHRASEARPWCRCSPTATSPSCTGCRAIPSIPLAVKLWKGPLKWLGNAAIFAGLLGAAVHFVKFGRKAHRLRTMT